MDFNFFDHAINILIDYQIKRKTIGIKKIHLKKII
jgi:hypothetical protein